VATKDGSEPIDRTAQQSGGRRARTAAQQRAQQELGSTPEALTEQIEQTREELAATLDEIADRVSPKRVASRTTKKLTENVKESAASARETVTEKALAAKEVASEKAAAARVSLSDGAASAKAAVNDKTAAAKEALAERKGDPHLALESSPESTAPLPLGTAAGTAVVGRHESAVPYVVEADMAAAGDELPPIEAVEVPPLPVRASGRAVSPGYEPSGTGYRSPGTASREPSTGAWAGGLLPAAVKKEYVAAGGATLLALLVLLARRRSQR